MKKFNIILLFVAIAAVFMSAIVLLCSYKKNFDYIIEESMIAVFTGCIFAFPSCVVIFIKDIKEVNKHCYNLAIDYIKHFKFVDTNYIIAKNNLQKEIEYIDGVSTELANIITNNYLSSNKLRKIRNFLDQNASLYNKLYQLNQDENIEQDFINRNINVCVLCAVSLINFQDYSGENNSSEGYEE